MLSFLKPAVLRLLRRKGRVISKYPLAQYLRQFEVDCVLDVGANVGQYVHEIRSLGYGGRIESFEPLPSALSVLEKKAERDATWNIHRFGLGDSTSQMNINVGKKSATSSFLPLVSEDAQVKDDVSFVNSTSTEVKRLDDVYDDIAQGAKKAFMKIDTQGYEAKVLAGATKTLPKLCGLQVEVSLCPIYDGELLLEDIFPLVKEMGFTPFWIQNGYRIKDTMQLMQVDVFFFNKAMLPNTS